MALERSSEIRFQMRAREPKGERDWACLCQEEGSDYSEINKDIIHMKTELDEIYEELYQGQYMAVYQNCHLE